MFFAILCMFFFPVARGTGCLFFILLLFYLSPGVQGCMFIIALYVLHMFYLSPEVQGVVIAFK
jgi:hypothetical protein